MPTKFIIFTTQRTGSTYLRVWLNHHSEIRSHGELFLNNYTAPDGFYYFLKSQNLLMSDLFRNKYYVKLNKIVNGQLNYIFGSEVYLFLKSFFHNPNHPLAFNEFDEQEIFTNVEEAKYKNAKAVGFKLMFDQFKSSFALKRWIKNEKPKIIYLERKNKLALCASKYVKNITGIAHSESNINGNKFYADKSFFIKCIKKQLSIERQMLGFLSNYDHIRISYENFFTDPKTSKIILDYLGVNTDFSPEVKLKKINNRPLSEVFFNYKEIEKLSQSIITKNKIF